MRKMRFLIPCLMMAMVAFTGCSDDNDDNGGGNGSGAVVSAEESKEKLSEIGKSLIGLVNAEDQKELVQLGDYFAQIAGSLEIVENDEVDQVNPVQRMVSSLVATSQGNMAKVYALTRVNGDIYQASDYYANFVYDDNTDTWERTESTSGLVLKFDYEGKDAEIKVVASDDTSDFTYDGVTVKVPAELTATIKLGTVTLTSLEITTANVSNGLPGKADITVKIAAKDYIISTFVSATPQAVRANYSINIKATDAIKGEAYVNGNNITADKGTNEDINNRFHDAGVKVDIMGGATVTLECSSYRDLARKLEEVEDQYDNEASLWGESREAAQAEADVYKEYLTGNLLFTGSDKPFATLAFQPYMYESYKWEGVTKEYWEAEPLLQFEDESLISFEDYFDAASGPFKSLADSLEELARSFEGFLE